MTDHRFSLFPLLIEATAGSPFYGVPRIPVDYSSLRSGFVILETQRAEEGFQSLLNRLKKIEMHIIYVFYISEICNAARTLDSPA